MDKEQVDPIQQQTSPEPIPRKKIDPDALMARMAYAFTTFAEEITKLREEITALRQTLEENKAKGQVQKPE